MTRKQVSNFRNEFYRPDNTIFVITGNFNPNTIFSTIKKSLELVKNPTVPLVVNPYAMETKIIMDNYKKFDQPYVYVKKNKMVKQVYVYMAFPLGDLYNTKSKEIDMISQLLSYWFKCWTTISSERKKWYYLFIQCIPFELF